MAQVINLNMILIWPVDCVHFDKAVGPLIIINFIILGTKHIGHKLRCYLIGVHFLSSPSPPLFSHRLFVDPIIWPFSFSRCAVERSSDFIMPTMADYGPKRICLSLSFLLQCQDIVHFLSYYVHVIVSFCICFFLFCIYFPQVSCMAMSSSMTATMWRRNLQAHDYFQCFSWWNANYRNVPQANVISHKYA